MSATLKEPVDKYFSSKLNELFKFYDIDIVFNNKSIKTKTEIPFLFSKEISKDVVVGIPQINIGINHYYSRNTDGYVIWHGKLIPAPQIKPFTLIVNGETNLVTPVLPNRSAITLGSDEGKELSQYFENFLSEEIQDYIDNNNNFIKMQADDFKLFCRNHQDAIKIFEASKQWLKNRLHLEVSKEKSKIVNLRKNYSYFLGIKFKVHRKGKKNNKDTKWVIKSHIQEKALDKIKTNVRKHITNIQKPKKNTGLSINLYNSFVMGIHNYYNCATNCNADMAKLSNQTRTKIFVRLKIRRVNKSDKLSDYIKKVYGKSEMLRIIGDKPLLPLSYI